LTTIFDNVSFSRRIIKFLRVIYSEPIVITEGLRMNTHIDRRMIEAGMRQGRIERAIAFRHMARATQRGLRLTAKMIVAVFS